ncbi:MAG: 5-formyltetrahydrofolate cyclo-ligase [Luminiphilus sp.]|jgi:5-formyltetrahydrofolate cyclo-ligase|nr:5-formyltetrahydrofolate cyclo-ligase [Luminiphilus sp.]MDG1460266.1 5-formyltetrahydrofolate cyclo-ligase [Luminiphilus sp.]
MSSSTTKITWRRKMRHLRDEQAPVALPPLIGTLTALPLWQSASVIASYCQAGSEQSPSQVEEAAVSEGKTIVYPRVLGAGEMVFKTGVPRAAFETNRYGIDEPPATAATFDVSTIDLFLIPLLACDQFGTRLGYGGGYYDRLLESTAGFRCGLGFDFQRVTELPKEQHDVRMQALLTESGLELF